MRISQITQSIPLRSSARWCAMTLAVVWLSGCAMAPGLSIGKGVKAMWGSGDARTADATVSAPGQAPPSGALLRITPELISQQRALKKS